jgi:hypothetical protein
MEMRGGPVNRLRAAYGAFWRRRADMAFPALLAALVASAAGVAIAVLLAPAWIPLPAAYFIGSVLLLRFAPGGDS